jgi:hypothetical protein
MTDNVTAFPKPIKATPAPLGLYLRSGHSDHRELTNVILSGPQKFFGVVIDARDVGLQKELREHLLSNKLDVILDPKTQASAFENGYRPSMSKLPWCIDRPHTVEDFKEFAGRQRMVQLAEFVINNKFTQVLAPTHFLSSVNDQWFGIDAELTRWLRTELDKRGGKHVPIIYSLAVANSLIRDNEQRAALISRLSELPIESLWLRVDKFGADASASALSRTLDAVVDLHSLQLPVVADNVGGIPGMALLAFGSVGGITHGITIGEKFSSDSWLKSKSGGGGWRIYCPPLGISLTRNEADHLFTNAHRAKALFGNRNAIACPRGIDDMLRHPVRAFVVQRGEEVANIGAVPAEMRVQQFLEKTVRPISDCALVAAKIPWKDSDVNGQKLKRKFATHLKHVESLRIALGNRAERAVLKSIALNPPTRIVREAKV